MNKFYQKSLWFQWLATIFLLCVFIGYTFLIYFGGLPVWLTILGFLLYVNVFQFTMAPFFKMTGVYNYVSPMLLIYGAKPEKQELHSGTPFDILMLFSFSERGKVAQKKMLTYFLEGLLEIIARIERGEVLEIASIYGDSYFFSDRTAKKLGFKIEETPSAVSFNVYLNALDIFWIYSFTQGKIAFPKLKNVKRAVTTGAVLLAHKAAIQRYLKYLQ